ncbi:MAG: ferrous iron transport protein A [Clostridium sp.]|jgi:ferrous iron transport protein A|nr:ferrous iron transport protein A [Clostridium sp.]
MVNINGLAIGQSAKIVKIEGDSPLTKRLSALGCLPGTDLALLRRAPLGDPLVVRFRGCCMAIRQKDAASIFVEY